MKLKAQIDGDDAALDVRRNGRSVSATVDSREYELDVSEPEPNTYLIKHKGRIYEAYVSPGADGMKLIEINNVQHEVRLIDPKQLRGSGVAPVAADGAAEIKTAMPGKVVRIIAEVGTEVKKGDGVLVVEAMKMQNEMKAPKDGIIKAINAAEGATVSAGDILAVIE